MRFDRGLTPKARAGILGAALAAVLAVGAIVGPYRASVFGGGDAVSPVAAVLIDPSSELIGYEAAMAVDGDASTAVGLRWLEDAAPCGDVPAAAALQVTPPSDMTVKRLVITPGRLDGDVTDDSALYRRPSMIEIRDGDLCQSAQMSAGEGPQSIKVSIDLIGDFTIGVASVAPVAYEQYPLALIGEIQVGD